MREVTINTQEIYFDEAGFTGDNLLDPAQPVFVFAGIAIDEDRATYIHDKAIADFGIQGKELKGSMLVKHRRGREAVSWILAEAGEHTHIMTANKEYALAGKFLEHILEPVLATHNSLFYALNFHKFIATLLHVSARSGDPHVRKSMKNFAAMMRSANPEQLMTVLDPLSNFDQSTPMGKLLTIAICHQNRIKDEVRTGRSSSWPLELSMTALHWLLASWSDQFEVLEVYCDQSKPLLDARGFFEAMIGREDKNYVRFGSQPILSITYNLKRQIQLVDSKDSHGIQIADVVASSIAHAYKNADDGVSKEWISLLKDAPANPIIPETTHLDLDSEEAYTNSMVLCELADRSVKGHDLFDDMASFVLNAKSLHPHYLSGVMPPDFD